MDCTKWMSVVGLTLALCSLVVGRVDLSTLTERRTPADCSSPGWRDAPYDIATLIGSYVRFNCRTRIAHSSTVWMYNGKKMAGKMMSKVTLSADNTTLRYGPVTAEDIDTAIGCEVTTSYGPLPSPMGRIRVKGRPSYSPKKIQTANVGSAFELDMNYTGRAPPSKFDWFKNGQPFPYPGGDKNRITTTSSSIIFTRVLPEDAGQYLVRASTRNAGEAEATTTLKVIFHSSGDLVQTGSSGTPVVSSKLAVAMALGEKDSTSSGAFHVSQDSSSYSADYALHIIRLFLHFKRATSSSRRQGDARLATERLLQKIAKLIGSHADLRLSSSDIERIANFTNCTQATRRVNCRSTDTLKYRTIDGTCNNFFYPLNGASGVPFARLLPANYEDGISQPFGINQLLNNDSFSPPWPSARYVSWKVMTDLKPPALTATHMFMQWAQFVDHDLDIAPVFEVECGCELNQTCIPIEINPLDSVYGDASANKGKCLPFQRSVPACTCSGSSLARNQINDLTSYIDASNVYGSTNDVAESLRLMSGGLLKQGGKSYTEKGNLPVQEDTPDFTDVPFFAAGDIRVNEQVGLTIMHTLWMREHNRIARKLSQINPCWNDEKLYQETRKIVGAMQQVISFKEYLPILFGRHMNKYIPRFRGYNPFVDASIPNSFAGAAYRFGHSLVRDELDRLDEHYRRLDIGPLDLNRAFFNPLSYFESGGTDPIARGLTVATSNPTDEFLNRVLTSQLFTESPDKLGMDLASLNIQRSRDHGLPTYREWEKFCRKLYPDVRTTFRDPKTASTLRELYGAKGFKEGIDLWVGGLAERRLRGAHIGPTFACIIGLTFSRLRDGDRFWYENPYVFSYSQRRELKKTSLAKVVCTNGDNIPKIQKSVFMPSSQRQSCKSLPEVNLWYWWDSRCYYEKYWLKHYFSRRG